MKLPKILKIYTKIFYFLRFFKIYKKAENS